MAGGRGNSAARFFSGMVNATRNEEDAMSQPDSIAHPRAKAVPILGGTAHVIVRPWSVGQMHEAKPIVIEIMQMIQASSGEMGLAEIVTRCEPEVMKLVQITIKGLPDGLKWTEIDYEDFLNLAQGVWETSILRPDGSGLLGKVVNLVASAATLRRSMSGGVSAPQSPSAAPQSSPPASPIEPSNKSSESSSASEMKPSTLN